MNDWTKKHHQYTPDQVEPKIGYTTWHKDGYNTYFRQDSSYKHDPKIKKKLVNEALEIFFDLRKIPGLKKKPSTSELIDWLKLLLSDDMPDEILKNADSSKAIPPLYGALLKNEQDVQLLERLAFMSRREANSK